MFGSLLGTALRAAGTYGLRPAARAATVGAGVLTSPLTRAASDEVLIGSRTFGGVAGVGVKSDKGASTLLASKELTTPAVTYGQVGTIGGNVGRGVDLNSELSQKPSTTQNVVEILGPDLLALGFTRAGGGALSTFAKTGGPMLALEGASYGLTGLASQTKVGQDAGFDEAMGFSEMNFKTGKAIGEALIGDASDPESAVAKQRAVIETAGESGSDFNPLNYIGQDGVTAGTAASAYVGNALQRALSGLDLL